MLRLSIVWNRLTGDRARYECFRVAPVFRVLRFGQAIRGLTFARLPAAIYRGLISAGNASVLGYVLVLTTLVTLLGATGVYAFERRANPQYTFGDALWFSAIMITTGGSDTGQRR